jgi:hypothetical protein
MAIFRLLVYILKKAIAPVALVLVWIYNVRPLIFLDKIFQTELMKKIKDNPDVPNTILGAIDVAILSFLLGVLSDVINKFFSKPIELTIKFKPSSSNSDSVTIKYDPDKLENAEATKISLKISGRIYKFYKLIKFIFRGIRVKIYWHAKWLSVTWREADTLLAPTSKPGAICFDILTLFSESDDVIEFLTTLYVTVNSSIKDQGNITAKVEINSDNKILCICFNGILNSLINLKIEPCKIFLTKGS